MTLPGAPTPAQSNAGQSNAVQSNTVQSTPVPSTPVQFNPTHPNFQAFAGMSSAPTPRAVFPRWAKLTVAGILIVDVLVAILVVATAPGLILVLAPLGVLSLFAIFGIIFVIQIQTGRTGSPGDAVKVATLREFATDNGLLYRARSELPAYPGCIFTAMGTRLPYVYDHLSTTSGRYLDFGNYHSYSETGDGPGGRIDPDPLRNSWGFIALQMDRQLPNILLISKNPVGGQTVLPAHPDPSQQLSLEGNFDDYFTLYCPKGFEQDALYIFTPDLMALLMDDAAPFDVEIIDKWMFLYVPRPFNMMDTTLYQRVFGILDTVGAKIVGQTSHYSDPALAAVAAPAVPQPVPLEPVPLQPVPLQPVPQATGVHWEWNPALVDPKAPAGMRLRTKSQRVQFIVIASVILLAFVAFIVFGTITGLGHFG
jgi:hypothetical protein